MSVRALPALALGIAACASGPPEPVAGPGDLVVDAAPTSVWDGVYTADQADRGAGGYAESCSSCHEANLRGNSNSPGLVGSSFLFIWEGRSVGELLTAIRTGMPTNAPASLPEGTYADVVAYLLEANGFPPGTRDLTAGPILDGVSITGSR